MFTGAVLYIFLAYVLGRRLRLYALPRSFCGDLPLKEGSAESALRRQEGFFQLPFDLLIGLTILSTAVYLNLCLAAFWEKRGVMGTLRTWLGTVAAESLYKTEMPVLLSAFFIWKITDLLFRLRGAAEPQDKGLLPLFFIRFGKLLFCAAGLLLTDLGFFFLPLLFALYIMLRLLWYSFLGGMLRLSNFKGKFRRPEMGDLFLPLMLLLAFLWGAFLVWPTFFLKDGTAFAGVTVFSDLAPHTALVRSFGVGANIPANYPHFGNAGMRYHFFFYFTAGMLNRLGLPLDWALNLPSMLGTAAFMQALGYAAVRLSGRLAAWPLTFLLFAFRSSFSGFVLLGEKLRAGLSLGGALAELRAAMSYAGPLQHDDWGLYNLNVYANQRHLLWGLALLLWLVLLFLPALEAPVPLRQFFRREAWRKSASSPSFLYLFLLCFPLAFWHGSAAIALLLILGCAALFSRDKERLLFLGVTVTAGAFFWMYFLRAPAPEAAAAVSSAAASSPLFHWGHILEDRSAGGVLLFLLTLWGPGFVFMCLAPFLQKSKAGRILSSACFLPSLFALCFSLTPDVTVNHKFFMMTQLLLLPFTADLLLRLSKAGRLCPLRRAAAAVLVLLLTFTGLTDFWAYRNQSKLRVAASMNSAFTDWLYEHTEPDLVNITPPWSYHSYFLTGRQSFYGHSYYAASAGYPCERRLDELKQFLAAAPGPQCEKQLRAFVKKNQLAWLLIDDSWRHDADFFINEKVLASVFPEAARFPDADGLTIYDLSEKAAAADKAD